MLFNDVFKYLKKPEIEKIRKKVPNMLVNLYSTRQYYSDIVHVSRMDTIEEIAKKVSIDLFGGKYGKPLEDFDGLVRSEN